VNASLRVATFNIRYGTANDGPDRWELRKPRALAFLESLAPELLGLQEALDFQIEEILAAFPHYRSIGVGREDGVSQGEYAAIIYDSTRLESLESGTFWFSDTPDIPGSAHWGNRLCRICTWSKFRILSSDAALWHFNVHVDHMSEPSRERSAAYLLERIAILPSGSNVIVTGDFNEHEDKPGILCLKQGGLRDSYRVLHPDESEVGTFSGFTDDFGTDKIDYIFVNDSITVSEAHIVRQKFDGGWPSDHAAVTATLSFP